jgi:transposase
MRDLFRYRKKLTAQIVAEKNRFQKILEDANIKLGSVVSDVFGASGTAITNAIIESQTDATQLVKLAHSSIRAPKETLRQALQGKITAHHRFMLTTIRKSIVNTERLMEDIDRSIEEHGRLYNVEMTPLQTVPGVGQRSAAAILSEIGSNMEAFPSARHLASWAGISPGNNESAGKKKWTNRQRQHPPEDSSGRVCLGRYPQQTARPRVFTQYVL